MNQKTVITLAVVAVVGVAAYAGWRYYQANKQTATQQSTTGNLTPTTTGTRTTQTIQAGTDALNALGNVLDRF